MKELIVKIKYTNTTGNFRPIDVQRALQHLFGINTDFEVVGVEEKKENETDFSNKPHSISC